MKIKIICTYDYDWYEGEKKFDKSPIEQFVDDAMAKIGAKFIGCGYSFGTNVRDMEFELTDEIKQESQHEQEDDKEGGE